MKNNPSLFFIFSKKIKSCSPEDISDFTDFVQLLIEQKKYFITEGTRILKQLALALHAKNPASILIPIIIKALSIHSSLDRYSTLLSTCIESLKVHNKKIVFLVTAQEHTADSLSTIKEFIKKHIKNVEYIHTTTNALLLHGFQLYSTGIRLEASYQRVIQDMYLATQTIGYIE